MKTLKSAGRALMAVMLLCVAVYGKNKPAERKDNVSLLLDYIHGAWDRLNSVNMPYERIVFDLKMKAGSPLSLYVPHYESADRVKREVLDRTKTPVIINITVLPTDTENFYFEKRGQGLLWVPKQYIATGRPGNEMHGWDSYFILQGLIKEGRTDIARDMVDNLIYEINNYGKVLCVNRTYCMDRSVQPFFTRMVLEVYYCTSDKEWLKGALMAAKKYYSYWVTGEHFVKQTGLSRYYGAGNGPCVEVNGAINYYDTVKKFYHGSMERDKGKSSPYDMGSFYAHAADIKKAKLKAKFYAADRAVRESGFCVSDRFGPFSAQILNYNPVCLNTLLYVMEKDLAEMNAIAGLEAETRAWIGSYLARKNKINELMWDEAKGAYCDYDFVRKCRSGYNFITAFYPMWAGIPDRSQAEKLARNLRIFEREGGLASSDSSVTGSSWDYPFGWAPVQVLVAQALAKYGYVNDAQRVAVKWCSTVLKEFLKYNFLFEKYYVENAGKTAYDAREGSCWTNASFLILLDMAGDRKNITAIK